MKQNKILRKITCYSFPFEITSTPFNTPMTSNYPLRTRRATGNTTTRTLNNTGLNATTTNSTALKRTVVRPTRAVTAAKRKRLESESTRTVLDLVSSFWAFFIGSWVSVFTREVYNAKVVTKYYYMNFKSVAIHVYRQWSNGKGSDIWLALLTNHHWPSLFARWMWCLITKYSLQLERNSEFVSNISSGRCQLALLRLERIALRDSRPTILFVSLVRLSSDSVFAKRISSIDEF